MTLTEVRLIGAEGEQLGVVPYAQAQTLASEAGLDLVMVSDRSVPPVVRIMNFGKLLYEQKKKLKDQKKNQQAQKVKEIKFRLNIAEHDYAHKIEQGIEFLDDGCKLKVTITFKGREMARTEIGFDLANRITEDLSEIGTVESPAKLLGKNINMSFNPKGSH